MKGKPQKMTKDAIGIIPAFTFRGSMQSGATQTFVSDMLVYIGEDVGIKANGGIEVSFFAGDKIVLADGIIYSFSADVVLGLA